MADGTPTWAGAPYPATFDVQYPKRLSPWKVVFNPWLLGLPAYMLSMVRSAVEYVGRFVPSPGTAPCLATGNVQGRS